MEAFPKNGRRIHRFGFPQNINVFMLKKIAILAILPFLTTMLFSQNDAIDSLKQALDTASGMSKVMIYGHLAKQFRNISEEKEWEYTEKGYLYALETDNKRGIALTTLGLGNLHMFKGEFEAAIDSFRVAEKIYESLEGKWEQAEEAKTRALMNIGLVYKYWGNCTLAIRYFEETMKIGEKLNHPYILLMAYINIGVCYQDMQMFSEAIRFQEKGLAISKSVQDVKGIGLAFLNIGIANLDLKDYKRAATYLDSAMSVFVEEDDYEGKAITYQNKAVLEDQKGNWEATLQFLEKAESEWGVQALRITILNLRAKTLLKLANYKAALGEAREAIVLATNQESLEMIKEASLTNAKAWLYNNNPDSVMYYLSLSETTADSFYHDKAINSLAAWEVELRVKESELEILRKEQLLEEEEGRRIKIRNLLLLSIIFSILAIGIGLYIWRSRRLISEQRNSLATNNRQLELSMAQQSFVNKQLLTSLQERQWQIEDSQTSLEKLQEELEAKSFILSLNANEIKKLKVILKDEEKRLRLYQERFDAEVREKLGIPVQISDGKKRLAVWTGSIPYLKIEDKYFRFTHDGHSITIRSSISKIIEELGPDRFLQISRSTLVNLDRVKKVHSNGKVELFGDDQELAISKRFLSAFLTRWDSHLSSRQET